MYCINCGVKLADSEKKCPLCGVRVFHPEFPQPRGEKLYPQGAPPATPNMSRSALTIISTIFLLAELLIVACDVQLKDGSTWSGYALGAIGLVYVWFVLPMWFHKPNPVIFTPCNFAAAALYLLFINYKVEGQWFWTFALPVIGCVCVIITALVTLLRYVRKGHLFIYGGAALGFAGFTLLLEFLIVHTFALPRMIWWSLYPMVVFAVIGLFLIFLGIYRPARQIMERKFFL